MDEEKVIDVTQVTKKQPWYKMLWNKIKDIKEVITDWCDDHFEIVAGALMAFAVGIWGYLFGWLDGRKEGYNIGEKDGESKGYREGYIDFTEDLKNSGYKVYGGYGENAGDLIVKKMTESHEEEIKQD